MLTHDDMLRLLAEQCAQEGSQRAWARKHKLSYRWVNNVLKGYVAVSPAICLALKHRQIKMFVPIEPLVTTDVRWRLE